MNHVRRTTFQLKCRTLVTATRHLQNGTRIACVSTTETRRGDGNGHLPITIFFPSNSDHGGRGAGVCQCNGWIELAKGAKDAVPGPYSHDLGNARVAQPI